MTFMEKTFAYMVGILDGEGSVQLLKVSHNHCFKSPVITISNNDLNILNIFKDVYGGTIVKKKIYKDNHKQSYEWKATYHKAIKIMKDLRPYMRHSEKIRRVDLILNKYLKLTKRNGKYSKEEIILKQEFEKEFFHPSNTIDKNP